MEIRPIKTEADYRAALGEVETMMTAEADTPEGDRLDILVTLVEAYERKHYALDLPDPFEAIKFCMNQKCLSPKDLESMIGRQNLVQDIRRSKYGICMHSRPRTSIN